MPAYEQEQQFVDKNLSTIITKLQRQLPGNLRIKVGHVEGNYTAESESVELFFNTGFKHIVSIVGTCAGEGQFTINWVSFTGGEVNCIVRDRGVVHPIGTGVAFYWIGVGE